jgi:hypothetical protein
MTTTHTPGPWTAARPPSGAATEAPYWIDADGRRIADVWAQLGSTAANARLVAAAPALLAALQAMLAKHDDRDGMSDMWPREAAMARAAIAAAGGLTP